MKKIFSFFLSLIIFSLPFGALVGCGDRAEVLKVYNLGEYMDEDVIDGFEQWYKNETGKNIKLSYKTYSTNEDMYTEIYKKKADYDVVCSSDYILSRMLKNNLLLPIDREFVYGDGGESKSVSSSILQFVNDYENFDGQTDYVATERYSVPYMWGTFGVMYRKDLTTNENGDNIFDWKNLSWDMLFKAGAFEGQRYMKNSIRDAYASASIVAHSNELSVLSNGFTDYNDSYKTKLSEIINDTSSENMSSVESVLKAQKDYIFAYESDDGKDDMVTESPSALYGLFWSCDAGYAMAENTSLYYGVPKEGANVWVDSFVIPKYAKNVQVAQYFLKYICQTDIAYLNREYAGCSSPITEVAEYSESIIRSAWNIVKGEQVDLDEDAMADAEYYIEIFEETEYDDFGDMFIEMLFPPQNVLSRCAVMRDSDKNACIEMAKMWIRTKAS